MTEYKARCMKCKAEVKIVDPVLTEIKGKSNTKKNAVKGKCGTCGTTVFRILKKSQ